jgi:hypothetical protein
MPDSTRSPSSDIVTRFRLYGVDGRFTHGGEYVILTPVFKSGGRQRVLRVADGTVRTVALPATTHLFDHVGAFWWRARKRKSCATRTTKSSDATCAAADGGRR